MRSVIQNQDCLEFFKTIPDESVHLVVTDCPYRIIAGGVRTEYKNDEVGGCLNKRDYSKTDPKGVLGRQPLGAKWQKEGADITSAVKDGKMFEFNEIKFHEWLPDVYRVLKKF